MKELTTIPPEVAALIPKMQLEVTQDNVSDYSEIILKLQAQLKKCPKIKETDNMKEHPAVFHYFCGATDIYICEYDRKEDMFGFAILGGDLDNSEWGYFNLRELTSIPQLNIDFNIKKQSIEKALHTAYPDRYPQPPSRSNLITLMNNKAKRIKYWAIYLIMLLKNKLNTIKKDKENK